MKKTVNPSAQEKIYEKITKIYEKNREPLSSTQTSRIEPLLQVLFGVYAYPNSFGSIVLVRTYRSPWRLVTGGTTQLMTRLLRTSLRRNLKLNAALRGSMLVATRPSPLSHLLAAAASAVPAVAQASLRPIAAGAATAAAADAPHVAAAVLTQWDLSQPSADTSRRSCKSATCHRKS